MDELGLSARLAVVVVALTAVGGLVTLGGSVVSDLGGSLATILVVGMTVIAVVVAGVAGIRGAGRTETRYW
ncbi:hypothetical protein [Salinirubrum litoreum]|uniref:Major facilitator superfamily (MFS) profile domain-containing protein n=1 Tax=Salinirubrum litoreum TaxID=1126234 RepID=A0ABD5R7I0_9EURY|nr:hypothetical protein [Salinirubrum litoreum]